MSLNVAIAVAEVNAALISETEHLVDVTAGNNRFLLGSSVHRLPTAGCLEVGPL